MTLLYKAQTRFLFHAHIKIKVSIFCPESVFDVLFAILEDIDKKYNSYQLGSHIDRINKNTGNFVEVDDETIRLLRKTIYWSDFFEGLFDITIMPLIRLWGFYRDDELKVPDKYSVEEVKQTVNYKNIEIEGNLVRISKGQEIITGSFLKAYAVDKLIETMKDMSMNDAIINAGGSTIYAMNNESHPSWDVNVREPEENALLHTLHLANKCYTTSSQSQTYVDINGQQYGHILNPVNGFPASNKHVGIVTDSCFDGDIISTGLFLQTLSDFENKIEQLKNTIDIDGFITDCTGKRITTLGFNKYKITDV